jgi:hypothetical protein
MCELEAQMQQSMCVCVDIRDIYIHVMHELESNIHTNTYVHANTHVCIQELDLLRKMDEQRKVLAARKHIEDEIMQTKCPACNTAFYNFDGCFAVSCASYVLNACMHTYILTYILL